VSVTLGCSTGLGLTVGTITVGCAAPTSSAPPATSTTTPPATTTTTPTTLPIVGGLLGGISSTLGGL
jgi:hypothetical protein